MSIIKKNKLPLFLLAVVMMLSAFYIIAPKNDGSLPSGGGGLDPTPTNSYFAEERLNILDERSTIINELESQIASGDLSVVQITNALEEINRIMNLKYLEVELETAIVSLGYEDVLIEQYDKDINLGTEVTPIYKTVSMVDIKIVDDQMTPTEYIQISKMVKSKLGGNEYKINLTFTERA